jgi:hypothetical protein
VALEAREAMSVGEIQQQRTQQRMTLFEEIANF